MSRKKSGLTPFFSHTSAMVLLPKPKLISKRGNVCSKLGYKVIISDNLPCFSKKMCAIKHIFLQR